MSNERPVVVYLLYGDSVDYHNELSYSVLSLLKHTPDAEVVLVTTAPHVRDDLPIGHLVVTDEEIREWTLGGMFSWRSKILAIRTAMERLDRSVLYLDTDTAFRTSAAGVLATIAPTESVLHCREYAIGDAPEWQSLLNARPSLPHWRAFGPATMMCNAGVVGVHRQNLPAIETITAMCDDLLSAGVLQYTQTAEQLSISVGLDEATKVHFCAEAIEHYYWSKDFYRLQFRKLFGERTKSAFDALLAQPLPRLVEPTPSLMHLAQARLRGRAVTAEGRAYASAYAAYLSAPPAAPACSSPPSSRRSPPWRWASSWRRRAFRRASSTSSRGLARRRAIRWCVTRCCDRSPSPARSRPAAS
jgi:hypothetical protein